MHLLHVVIWFSFRWQQEISAPISKVVETTKILTSDEAQQSDEDDEGIDDQKLVGEGEKANSNIPNVRFDTGLGTYEVGLLVDVFGRIMKRIHIPSTSNDKHSKYDFEDNRTDKTHFPYNELHEKSPFRSLFDWEKYLSTEDN